MKSIVRRVDDHGIHYDALAFVCPGCNNNLHMLPVNTTKKSPSWEWDGNLEAPTLSPSILTKWGKEPKLFVCHSFLKAGVFEYLADCTHVLRCQFIKLSDLPDWFVKETEGDF